MKKILFLVAGLAMLFTSCRYSDCDDPAIVLDYQLDVTDTLFLQFDTYEKGSGFSKRLSSEQDAVYLDTGYITPYGPATRAKHSHIKDSYDYLITMAATGKTYKITDIGFSGKKRVRVGGIISENKTRCTRTVNYSVNGQKHTVEGTTYEYGYGGGSKGEITITK
jgi:hypothetical protein